MNKSNRTFLIFLTFILGVPFLLFGCDLTAGKPSASQPPASTPVNQGAGSSDGAAQLSVSDGVILLTPGQPLPTVDMNHIPGITPVATTSTPVGETNQNPTQQISMALTKLLGSGDTPSVFPSCSMSMNESLPSASGNVATTLQADMQGANYHFVLTSAGAVTDAIHYNGQDYSVVSGKAQPGSATLALNWDMWKLDPGVMFGAAAASTITPQAGTTLEGRPIDVYTVDSSSLGAPLPDTSMGMLPYVITAIQGTIWIDHATGGLVKADLQFAANVKKPGQTTPSATGKGEFHITVSQIGQVTVSLP